MLTDSMDPLQTTVGDINQARGGNFTFTTQTPQWSTRPRERRLWAGSRRLSETGAKRFAPL